MRKFTVAALLVAFIACAQVQAQTPEIDALRTRAEAGDAGAQFNLGRHRWSDVAARGVRATMSVASVPGQQRAAAPDALDAFARYNRVTTYDQYFSKYSKRFFGVGFDWYYFKAQALAESTLDEDARSPSGAVGVMQIMPPTFEEIRRRNPAIRGRINHPRWNIAAGIWYNRQNFVAWEAVQPLIEQLKFMFGSYNAGRSSIRRARAVAVELGLDGTVWESITQGLPEVTGRRSSETLMYIDRIFGIKQVLR
jgi:membrane-bound lytic murein transglycosylase F